MYNVQCIIYREHELDELSEDYPNVVNRRASIANKFT